MASTTVKFGRPDALMAKQIAAIARGYGCTNAKGTAYGLAGNGWRIIGAGQINGFTAKLHSDGWHVVAGHNAGNTAFKVHGFITVHDKRARLIIAGDTARYDAGKKGRPVILAISPAGHRYLFLLQASDMANMVYPLAGQIAGL